MLLKFYSALLMVTISRSSTTTVSKESRWVFPNSQQFNLFVTREWQTDSWALRVGVGPTEILPRVFVWLPPSKKTRPGPLCGNWEVNFCGARRAGRGLSGRTSSSSRSSPALFAAAGPQTACTPCLGFCRPPGAPGTGRSWWGRGLRERPMGAPRGAAAEPRDPRAARPEGGRDAEAMGGGARSPDVRAGRRQDVLLHRDLLAVEDQVRVAEARLLPERAERPQQARGVLRVGHSAALGHRASCSSAATRPARRPARPNPARVPAVHSARPPDRTHCSAGVRAGSPATRLRHRRRVRPVPLRIRDVASSLRDASPGFRPVSQQPIRSLFPPGLGSEPRAHPGWTDFGLRSGGRD